MPNFYAISFIGSVYFLLCFFIAHLFIKDFDFRSDALSRYAIGKRGLILTSGFFAVTLAQFLLSMELLKSFNWIAGVTLLLAAVGALLTSTFKMDDRSERTVGGFLHNAGVGGEFIFFPISVLFLSPSFSNTSVFIGSLIAGLVVLAISLLLAIAHILNRGNFGLIERVNVVLIALLMIFFSYSMMRV